MKLNITVLFLAMCFASSINAQQSKPSGSIDYGGYKTITCLQGGNIIIQQQHAKSVKMSWNGDMTKLSYKPPNDKRRTMNYNSSSMVCLVEEPGRESVPIK